MRWVATDDLDRNGADELLAGADAIWCAPGSPYRSLDGALEGIRFARERGVPFLGTCAGFQHAVIEVARHLAGIPAADHEEYGREGGDLVIHELLCSLAGQRLDVRIVDDQLAEIYGSTQVEERYYCTFGLNPLYLPSSRPPVYGSPGSTWPTASPGSCGCPTIRYFLLTLFVPADLFEPRPPHPLVAGLVRATVGRAPRPRTVASAESPGGGGPASTSTGGAWAGGCGPRTSAPTGTGAGAAATTTSRGPFGCSSRQSARPVAATIRPTADHATSVLPMSLPFMTACRPVIHAIA